MCSSLMIPPSGQSVSNCSSQPVDSSVLADDSKASMDCDTVTVSAKSTSTEIQKSDCPTHAELNGSHTKKQRDDTAALKAPQIKVYFFTNRLFRLTANAV